MEGAKTIKVENGELYVIDDKIVGRMETIGDTTRYLKGDKLHREQDLPAGIERNINGAVTCESYWRDGKKHRDGDLPAVIKRNNAQCLVTYEAYYRDNKRHRDRGLPAIIKRNDAGEVICEEYWRDGQYMSNADIKAAKLAQELAAANELAEKLAAGLEIMRGGNTIMREKLQKIRALLE